MALNLGQVAGLFIGNTAPENTALIWWDSTPSQLFHKVYNTKTGIWEALDKFAIRQITYSELVTLAGNGLSIGSYYRITDKSNALALSITQTKIQYVDNVGNIVIDDLGSNQEYITSSTNLVIDDISGVFDNVTKKVVFSFLAQNSSDLLSDDFVLLKGVRNNISKFLKVKLSNLISLVPGNSITWNKGFFFNFLGSINNIKNKTSGIVGYDKYQTDIQGIAQDLQIISDGYSNFVQTVNQTIANGLSAENVYAKQLPTAPTTGVASDIARYDSLTTIINKIQKWITTFKTADGIKLTSSFSEGNATALNNNDTVDSAFRKISAWFTFLSKASSINLSNTFVKKPTNEVVLANDSIEEAISKIEAWIESKVKEDSNGVLLHSSYSVNNVVITPGTTPITNVIGKLFYDNIFKMTFDAYISTAAELLNLGHMEAKSILVKKGIYNIPFDIANGVIIECSNVLNGNILVVFEPGVIINVTSNVLITTDSVTLFGGPNGTVVDSGKWIGNGTIIKSNGVNQFVVNAFNYLANINDFIVDVTNYTTRFSNCINLNHCISYNPNNVSRISFIHNSNLSNCVGRYTYCYRHYRCSGHFSYATQLIECFGTYSTSGYGAQMLDQTPVGLSAAGGWNHLTVV